VRVGEAGIEPDGFRVMARGLLEPARALVMKVPQVVVDAGEAGGNLQRARV
jgi:hypothetical protein